MSSAFSFEHNATPVSNPLYACLSYMSLIRVDKSKDTLKHNLFFNFQKFFVVSYSHANSVAVHLKHFFLLFVLLFTAWILVNGHAVTQNYVFVVYQSESTKNNPHQ